MSDKVEISAHTLVRWRQALHYNPHPTDLDAVLHEIEYELLRAVDHDRLLFIFKEAANGATKEWITKKEWVKDCMTLLSHHYDTLLEDMEAEGDI